MALLHPDATISPTKLEVVQTWLRARSWVPGDPDDVEMIGGYRFDDPDGEVGIETLLVRWPSGAVVQVPLTYRSAPLEGAEDFFVCTMEHSVLGRRWVHHAVGDPVYATALVGAMLTGAHEAPMQIEVDGALRTRDPVVRVHGTGSGDRPETVELERVDGGSPHSVLHTSAGEVTVPHRLLADIPLPAQDPTATLVGSWDGTAEDVLLASLVEHEPVTEERYYADPVPELHRPYTAAPDRYQHLDYRRVGDSGLLLPPISLGLWWNFGDNRPFDTQRAVLRHAFDRGVTHFDLANNYGPPYGSAEENFGRMMRSDFAPYRNELVISTKAGWDMWPGPYGKLGSRKYLLSSLDESLARMSLDHVDIFYSHRADPVTPVAETIGALHTAVEQGKSLYVGISSYSPERTAEAVRIARELGTPLVIHQPSYSLLNRWVEGGLLDTLGEHGLGAIGFSPLAQGLLTGRYLDGRAVERAGDRGSFDDAVLTADNVRRLRGLSEIAEQRGQTLAQMAIAWVLRPGGVTSALIGASSVEQLDENLAALQNLDFAADELAAIDALSTDADGVDLWKVSADL